MFINLPEPKRRKTGYVYIIKSGEYHKIGLTRREPGVRIREFTTPEGVDPVWIIETSDPEGLEKFLHHVFEDKRAEREWFKLNEEDVEFIKTVKW